MSMMRIATLVLAATLVACGGSGTGNDDSMGDGDGRSAQAMVPAQNAAEGPLSEAEVATLMRLREEEKLARDVYRALGSFDRVFANIERSEQRHMDAIKLLLDRYGLADPAQAEGAFSTPELQSLYTQLVADGHRSQVDAYRVGAFVEELDLGDLDRLTAQVSHSDVRSVYGQLARGSRNHLRAFHGRLTAANATYTPVVLPQATFDTIVSSARETGKP